MTGLANVASRFKSTFFFVFVVGVGVDVDVDRSSFGVSA